METELNGLNMGVKDISVFQNKLSLLGYNQVATTISEIIVIFSVDPDLNLLPAATFTATVPSA
jgi:hypothetical protein